MRWNGHRAIAFRAKNAKARVPLIAAQPLPAVRTGELDVAHVSVRLDSVARKFSGSKILRIAVRGFIFTGRLTATGLEKATHPGLPPDWPPCLPLPHAIILGSDRAVDDPTPSPCFRPRQIAARARRIPHRWVRPPEPAGAPRTARRRSVPRTARP